MTRKAVAEALWAALVVLAILVSVGALAFTSPAPAGNSVVEWDPGFTFFLPSGLAYVNTSSPVFLTQNWQVGARWLILDNTNLSIVKLPASGAAVSVTITQMNFGTVQPGAAAFVFIASAPAGATVWFNLTNLQDGMPYTFKVDNLTRGQPAADISGAMSLSWSSWSTHQFEVDVRASYLQGPNGPEISCSSGPVFLFVTRLSCSLPSQVSNASAWQWRVNGQPVGFGQTMDYYVTDFSFAGSSAYVSLVGSEKNVTEPQVLQAMNVPIDPMPASALGWAVTFLLLVLAFVAFSNRTPLPDPHEGSFRAQAIRVYFLPDRSLNPTKVGYLLHDPKRYSRRLTRTRRGLEVVYGIRPNGNREIVSVHEPIEDAPKAWVQRALLRIPEPQRDEFVKRLWKRGIL